MDSASLPQTGGNWTCQILPSSVLEAGEVRANSLSFSRCLASIPPASTIYQLSLAAAACCAAELSGCQCCLTASSPLSQSGAVSRQR